jgi:hypothetical protein
VTKLSGSYDSLKSVNSENANSTTPLEDSILSLASANDEDVEDEFLCNKIRAEAAADVDDEEVGEEEGRA